MSVRLRFLVLLLAAVGGAVYLLRSRRTAASQPLEEEDWTEASRIEPTEIPALAFALGRPEPGPAKEIAPDVDARRTFELADLGELAATLATIADEHGPLDDDQLVAAVAERAGEIRAEYRELVLALAAAAKSKHLVGRDGERWIGGTKPPAPFEPLVGVTLEELSLRAGELLRAGESEPQIAKQLATEVHPRRRVPRAVRAAAETATSLAVRRSDAAG